MSDERIPAQVWPMASFLAEEMEARGWTALDVALRMGDEWDLEKVTLLVCLLLAVHRDSMSIDDATFAGLGRAFDVSPDLFRNLDAVWRRHPNRRVPFVCPDHLFAGECAPAPLAPPAEEPQR